MGHQKRHPIHQVVELLVMTVEKFVFIWHFVISDLLAVIKVIKIGVSVFVVLVAI